MSSLAPVNQSIFHASFVLRRVGNAPPSAVCGSFPKNIAKTAWKAGRGSLFQLEVCEFGVARVLAKLPMVSPARSASIKATALRSANR
jgi:hypothetical protein